MPCKAAGVQGTPYVISCKVVTKVLENLLVSSKSLVMVHQRTSSACMCSI